jgi:hypothetical protein
MRDALLGGMSRDYDTFKGHVLKVWDQIGEKIQAEQARIDRMFQNIDRELATAGGDRFDQMLYDFKKLNPTPDQLEAYKKKIQQERDLAVTPSDRFSADDTNPPLVRPDDRLPAFPKPGSADAARLQFNLGQDSYQRQRDEIHKQQLEEARKQTGVLLELNDGLKFTVLDTF